MVVAESANLELQTKFWNQWNAEQREESQGEVSRRQAEVVGRWLAELGRTDHRIIEVGCGAGWMAPKLMRFGQVTGTDLSDELLARAEVRYPEARFVAGDFMTLDIDPQAFDVVVSLEVLSHVADQPRFVEKLATILRPGGHLMLATQNRPVLEKYNSVPPPAPGQLRSWVSASELRELLEPRFVVRQLFSVTPAGTGGSMRIVNSPKLNRPVRAVVGDRFERLKERLGFGWTLMCLAQRS